VSQGTPPGPAPAAPEPPPAGWLRIQCRPGKAEGHLVFPYQLTNGGPLPVLAMDAWPRSAAGADPVADAQCVQVLLRPDGVVVLGKYVPALADAARPVVPPIPLCTLIKPGETIERELRVRLPFAEQNANIPEALLSRYEPAEVKGLIFAIGWWPANQPGIAAAPWRWAPDYQIVHPLARLPPAGAAQQRFPTNKLEILRRRDAFPRAIPAHPDLEAG
jgi:hypothetical protein